jgi:hypothetical protein
LLGKAGKQLMMEREKEVWLYVPTYALFKFSACKIVPATIFANEVPPSFLS